MPKRKWTKKRGVFKRLREREVKRDERNIGFARAFRAMIDGDYKEQLKMEMSADGEWYRRLVRGEWD